MKIYLASPVNGRKEKTLKEKQKAAMKRIDEMADYLVKVYPYAEFINPVRKIFWVSERETWIMGMCVTMVMESDIVILDDGWESSQGCTVERFVALQYGKQVYTFNHFKLKEKLDNYESK